MYSCGWKSLSAYNPAPKEIRKDCHRQSSWKGFRFLLEDTRVAQMLPLTGAWIQACHSKRTIYKFNSVCSVQTWSNPSCGYKCTCQAKIQEGNLHIYMLHGPKNMQLHLVPPHPTAYSRSLASPCHFCFLAPSFAPSIVSFSNRWGFKPPLSALFSTTSPSCKCEAKDGKKTEAWCTHLQIPLIMPRQRDRHAYRWHKYAHTDRYWDTVNYADSMT